MIVSPVFRGVPFVPSVSLEVCKKLMFVAQFAGPSTVGPAGAFPPLVLRFSSGRWRKHFMRKSNNNCYQRTVGGILALAGKAKRKCRFDRATPVQLSSGGIK